MGGEMHFGEISLIIVNVLYLIGLQVKKERKKGIYPVQSYVNYCCYSF